MAPADRGWALPMKDKSITQERGVMEEVPWQRLWQWVRQWLSLPYTLTWKRFSAKKSVTPFFPNSMTPQGLAEVRKYINKNLKRVHTTGQMPDIGPSTIQGKGGWEFMLMHWLPGNQCSMCRTHVPPSAHEGHAGLPGEGPHLLSNWIYGTLIIELKS